MDCHFSQVLLGDHANTSTKQNTSESLRKQLASPGSRWGVWDIKGNMLCASTEAQTGLLTLGD